MEAILREIISGDNERRLIYEIWSKANALQVKYEKLGVTERDNSSLSSSKMS